MILTGPAIERDIENGKIIISPFDASLVGPNSIDLRLSEELAVYSDLVELPPPKQNATTRPLIKWGCLDMHEKEHRTKTVKIPKAGFVLWPEVLYLGCTIETIRTDHYVPIVEGRSSIGRLGMGVHVTAGFCDVGFLGTITLEITVKHPLRVYAGTAVCQAYFLTPEGAIRLYAGRYQGQEDPTPSRLHQGA